MISKPALQSHFQLGAGLGQVEEETIPEQTSEDLLLVIQKWQKDCSEVSDVSGFVRHQICEPSDIKYVQFKSKFRLYGSSFASASSEQLTTIVQLSFARLFSIYTGDSHVCFASLTPTAKKGAEPNWTVQHCKIDVLAIDDPKTFTTCSNSAVPLSVLQTGNFSQFWGASISVGSTTLSEILKEERLPIASSSLHLHLSLLPEGNVNVEARFASDTILLEDAHLLCSKLVNLLEQLNDGVQFIDLDPITVNEKRAILEDHSRSRQTGSEKAKSNVFIHELISNIAKKHKQKAALVVPSGEEITYEKLDTVSDRLANQLLQQEIGIEDHVAFLLEKNELLTTSILAIMKAGGCVTPLVNELTDERIRYILQDTDTKVWIVDSSHEERAQQILSELKNNTIKIMSIDKTMYSDQEKSSKFKLLKNVKLSSSNKAYTIYTSGSTGVPKAVILEHGNLSSFAFAKIDSWNITSSSRLLQFSAPIWDVSVGDFIFALTNGATLVLQDRFAAAHDIDATIDRLGITHAVLTPTVAEFISSPHSCLEALLLTGEALPIALRDRLLKLVPTVLNGGAPSEVTILALMTSLQSQNSMRWTPFGRPIGDVTAVILNESKEIVPIGGVGELYLAGKQVSRGYLHQEEKTRAAFLHLDIAAKISHLKSNNRFYRTGDLARLHANGEFELLGRIDGQLKYRGVRMESQEIEDAILAADRCIQRAVVCVKSIKGSIRLLAWLYVHDGQEDGKETLATRTGDLSLINKVSKTLFERLGATATPNAYICSRKKIALTISGKLDRKLLNDLIGQAINAEDFHLITPGAQLGSKAVDQHSQSSRFATSKEEIQVAQAFGAALGLNPKEIDANLTFEQLGGDSLTAVRILTNLRKQGIHAEISYLLGGAGSIIGISSRMSESTADMSKATTRSSFKEKAADLDHKDRNWVLWRYGLDESSLEEMFFATSYQANSAGLGYALRLGRPQSIEWNQPEWTCHGPTIQTDDLRSAWAKTVKEHADFRTAIAYTQDFRGVLCVYKPDRHDVELKSFFPTNDAEHDRDLYTYMDQDRIRGLDEFGKVPFRLALIGATQNRPQRFILSFPHSLACGWSMRLMLKTLLSHLNGEPQQAGDDKVSFKKYTEAVLGRDMVKLENWWSKELKTIDATTWPINFFQSPKSSPVVNRQFDANVCLDTKELSKTLGSSLFSICMSAFILSLALRKERPKNWLDGKMQISTSYVTTSRFFDELDEPEKICGPTLDVLLAIFGIDLDKSLSHLLKTCHNTVDRAKGKEHLPMKQYHKFMDPTMLRSALQASMIFQNLPDLPASEGKISMELGFEQMPTSCCIFFQITPHPDRLLLRTAFDSRLLSPNEATAFVDDMRCLIGLFKQMPEAKVGDIVQCLPSRAEAIRTLPRPTALEHFDLPPMPPSFWLRRLMRGIFLTLWFNFVVWPIRKSRFT